MCDSENRFLTYEQIVTKFGQCLNWLEYQSIIKAILQHWKFFLETEGLNDDNIDVYNLLLKEQKPAKNIYQILTGKHENMLNKYINQWLEKTEK